MAKRRRGRSPGQRVRSRNARSPAAPNNLNDFDDQWLQDIRENTRSRYIDLTDDMDRRLWHPSRRWSPSPYPEGLHQRIVIVPEGHKLARHQTYGGKYSLRSIRKGWHTKQNRRSSVVGRVNDWPYGKVSGHARYTFSTARPGHHLPWQVIVCVRRKRRKEVLFATRSTGKGSRARKRVRSSWSNVRC